MKNGTAYAGKLKKAWVKFRNAASPAEIAESSDPMRSLAVGVLGVHTHERKAERAVDRMLEKMVDWNEVRVSNADEVCAAIGSGIPQAHALCQRLLSILHDIYNRENILSLDRLHSVGRREARQYLEGLTGIDEFTVAHVMLWSLGGHAIPVNDPLLELLCTADLVNPDASRAEIQAFLERHVSAAEGKLFVTLMRDFEPPKSAKSARTAKASGSTRTTGKKSRRAKAAKKKTAKKARSKK